MSKQITVGHILEMYNFIKDIKEDIEFTIESINAKVIYLYKDCTFFNLDDKQHYFDGATHNLNVKGSDVNTPLQSLIKEIVQNQPMGDVKQCIVIMSENNIVDELTEGSRNLIQKHEHAIYVFESKKSKWNRIK
jgi:hypothetical protein